jgi:hypothetical protein
VNDVSLLQPPRFAVPRDPLHRRRLRGRLRCVACSPHGANRPSVWVCTHVGNGAPNDRDGCALKRGQALREALAAGADPHACSTERHSFLPIEWALSNALWSEATVLIRHARFPHDDLDLAPFLAALAAETFPQCPVPMATLKRLGPLEKRRRGVPPLFELCQMLTRAGVDKATARRHVDVWIAAGAEAIATVGGHGLTAPPAGILRRRPPRLVRRVGRPRGRTPATIVATGGGR